MLRISTSANSPKPLLLIYGNQCGRISAQLRPNPADAVQLGNKNGNRARCVSNVCVTNL